MAVAVKWSRIAAIVANFGLQPSFYIDVDRCLLCNEKVDFSSWEISLLAALDLLFSISDLLGLQEAAISWLVWRGF